MLVLVSGANYFVMFVGWEGMLQCLKWVSLNLISDLYSLHLFLYLGEVVNFSFFLYGYANTTELSPGLIIP